MKNEEETKIDAVEQLIILGNGFDLAAGLPSSYKEFLGTKLSRMDFDGFPEIKSTVQLRNDLQKREDQLKKNSIGQIYFDTVASIIDVEYMKLPANAVDFVPLSQQIFYRIPELEDGIKVIEYLMGNDWSVWEVLLLYNSNFSNFNMDFNWQDIESLIYRVINSVRDSDFEANLYIRVTSIFTNGFEKSKDGFVSRDDFFSREAFIMFICLFDKYSVYGDEKVPTKNNENYFIRILAGELTKFENSFKFFLIENQEVEMYKKNSSEILTLLTGKKNASFNLLNFNYTQPELNLSNIENDGATIFAKNIHGIAKKQGEIIFGIDNANIDADLSMIEYSLTKSYRTMRNRQNPQPTLYNKGIKQIKFYGHSFGEADYGYFFQIFNDVGLLNMDIKLEFYYSIYEGSSAERILMSQKLSVAKLLETYATSVQGDLIGKTILTQLNNEDKLELIEI
ncbi:hypothetical protein ESZ50_00655 [Weissella muntiaci]|uniref:Uncharacterized protein n=1 Tax=Weissella muntiaci TaxID=2508881 RepID=A0A6C2CAN9_9LACO|nr:AbiH family protein [Weissella muntiaci]TYC51077.1 hypothetical protein ESZ50_00655 [Weissella muntiaci]